MSTVATRSPRPRAPSVRNLAALIGAALLVAALIAVLFGMLREPARIDRVTVRNPHPWMVRVDVSAAERDGWVPLGSLSREDERRFDAVLDQGEEWIFRFAYSGQEVEVHVGRDELEQSGWSIIVPDEFAERLRGAGVQESAG